MRDRSTIVGLGGSMAKVSRSRTALIVALEGAASAGARTDLLDIRELALPMYNPDDDAPTAAVTRLIETCHAADGMLWSSPMYVAGKFASDLSLHRPTECAQAAERVAGANGGSRDS